MIFQGEKVEFEDVKTISTNISDSEINSKYIAGEVRIVTEQARYPLDTINSMIDSNKYELMPEFQRRHRWSVEKKSKLIESFIMNVPIPPVFLYENEFSHYEVMDGLQRITTIFDFYSDKFQLTGLTIWPELNGKRYSELPEKIKQGIDRRYLSSIILLQESAKDEKKAQEMKQLVFERINSGGIPLGPQETRNALYNGPMNQLCIELSTNKYLCILFKIPHPELVLDDQLTIDVGDENTETEEIFLKMLDSNQLYSSMTDVELVLRFFALRNIQGYSNQFSDFLDKYLLASNKFSDELLDSLRILFEETIEFAYQLFGEKAFYLWRHRKVKEGYKWAWYERSTTTVYDPLMVVLSELLNNRERLIKKAKSIQKNIISMYEEKYKIFEGRNSNRSDIEKRIMAYREFFSTYVGE